MDEACFNWPAYLARRIWGEGGDGNGLRRLERMMSLVEKGALLSTDFTCTGAGEYILSLTQAQLDVIGSFNPRAPPRSPAQKQ